MGERLEIRPGVAIDASEISFQFVASGGPGGQNVNKVATKAVLSFDLGASTSFKEEHRERLLTKLAGRLTKEGVLVLHSSEFRSQERNQRAAIDRLLAVLRDGLHVPKKRRPTKPTYGSKLRRLDTKKRQGEKKKRRRDLPSD